MMAMLMMSTTTMGAYATPKPPTDIVPHSNDYGGGGSYSMIYTGGYLWKIDKRINTYSKTFTQNEILSSEIVNSWILYMLGILNGGVPSVLIENARSIYKNKVVDVQSIGGLYTKTYYLKRLLDPKHANATVPVPHQFAFSVVYYSSPDMISSNIAYIDTVNDGGPRLANVN